MSNQKQGQVHTQADAPNPNNDAKKETMSNTCSQASTPTYPPHETWDSSSFRVKDALLRIEDRVLAHYDSVFDTQKAESNAAVADAEDDSNTLAGFWQRFIPQPTFVLQFAVGTACLLLLFNYENIRTPHPSNGVAFHKRNPAVMGAPSLDTSAHALEVTSTDARKRNWTIREFADKPLHVSCTQNASSGAALIAQPLNVKLLHQNQKETRFQCQQGFKIDSPYTKFTVAYIEDHLRVRVQRGTVSMKQTPSELGVGKGEDDTITISQGDWHTALNQPGMAVHDDDVVGAVPVDSSAASMPFSPRRRFFSSPLRRHIPSAKQSPIKMRIVAFK